MKYLLPLLLFLVTIFSTASAQNYSCISPEYKTWFANSRNYLKGMRIDSIHIDANRKVYYPFRTARVGVALSPSQSYTNGGSWLGKAIVENIDGSGTYLLNKWSDTIFIKNDAGLNESWILHHDTSSVFIKATVVSIDTMTVANVFDSAKTIRINVIDGNIELTGDSLNNLELILSKEHGFFQAIELYLLPFHEPGDSAYDYLIDMYLNEYSKPFSYGNPSPGFLRQPITFRRVDYQARTNMQLFDAEAGDVFFYWSTDEWMAGPDYKLSRDSIVAKVQMQDHILYTVSSNYSRFENGVWYEGTNTFQIHADMNFPQVQDTAKMPEEWYTRNYFYYDENDSSFCRTSGQHSWYRNFLREDGRLWQFEDTRDHYIYKEGFGLVNKDIVMVAMEWADKQRLSGVIKNGQSCGSDNLPLSIGQDLKPDYKIGAYPNPVHDIVSIYCDEEISLHISLNDLLGRKMYIDPSKGKGIITFNVSHLPSGLYLLNVGIKGHNIARKILVQH